MKDVKCPVCNMVTIDPITIIHKTRGVKGSTKYTKYCRSCATEILRKDK